jgi:demethylmenaquinone methyltransferase/2-methoxy-6-polyprenyl-1,4-benzoquinol methylase
MTTDPLLAEQLAYYAARAQEYDESIHQTGRFASGQPAIPAIEAEWGQAVETLRGLGEFDTALELACGTGQWTRHLAPMGRALTALDGASEMLAVNRAALGDARIAYVQADLFQWEPDAAYDLVFFAFWISHVPPEALDGFLNNVQRAVKPGGRMFMLDEHLGGRQLSGPVGDDGIQVRPLHDGRTFRVVKRYYDPASLASRLQALGFEPPSIVTGNFFFTLSARRMG